MLKKNINKFTKKNLAWKIIPSTYVFIKNLAKPLLEN